jgi:EAL domain-containing protein (putative c-di-GMP-specific phosphodiesterase class I)
MVMADVESAIATLRDLKTLNVQLAIDDFGTGYSSLSYLKRFPIDVLKIDRSFVNDIAHSPDDATIVLSIVSLAHNLRLRVIAEGVETEAQLAYLQKHDCDEMQGFYFSRPLPAIEFAQLLSERKRLQLPVASVAT